MALAAFTASGHPYRVLESVVPRMPDAWIDVAIYLYASRPDAELGARTGGSGFLVHVPNAAVPGAEHVIAVTNRHVVENGASVVRLNTKEGKWDVRDLSELDWIYHPDGDDLAVSIISIDQQTYQYTSAGIDQLLTKGDVERYNTGIGDDVAIVGRFINHEGRQKTYRR
jgi:hypothetical protein